MAMLIFSPSILPVNVDLKMKFALQKPLYCVSLLLNIYANAVIVARVPDTVLMVPQ